MGNASPGTYLSQVPLVADTALGAVRCRPEPPALLPARGASRPEGGTYGVSES